MGIQPRLELEALYTSEEDGGWNVCKMSEETFHHQEI